jgi:HPt (histidine-containing phosphotransfer) domain-containing protein
MGGEDDLIADYRRRLPARIADIEAQAGREDWANVCRTVHKLRGSAAVYGFPAVSHFAAELEELLIANDNAPADAAKVEARRLLQDMRREIERETGSA